MPDRSNMNSTTGENKTKRTESKRAGGEVVEKRREDGEKVKDTKREKWNAETPERLSVESRLREYFFSRAELRTGGGCWVTRFVECLFACLAVYFGHSRRRKVRLQARASGIRAGDTAFRFNTKC